MKDEIKFRGWVGENIKLENIFDWQNTIHDPQEFLFNHLRIYKDAGIKRQQIEVIIRKTNENRT